MKPHRTMPSRNPEPQFDFVLTLRPLPGWSTPAIERLRLAAKVLCRGFGLRLTACHPVATPEHPKHERARD